MEHEVRVSLVDVVNWFAGFRCATPDGIAQIISANMWSAWPDMGNPDVVHVLLGGDLKVYKTSDVKLIAKNIEDCPMELAEKMYKFRQPKQFPLIVLEARQTLNYIKNGYWPFSSDNFGVDVIDEKTLSEK